MWYDRFETIVIWACVIGFILLCSLFVSCSTFWA